MRVLICNIVPNSLIVELKAPQAANNFCFNLLDNGCFDYAYSIVPVSYYHNDIQNERKIEYLCGSSTYNRLFRSLYFLYANLKCAFKAKNAHDIWFYNICRANFICFILLRFLFRKRVYAILLDYTCSSDRRSIQYYLPYLYKRSFGVISLSQRSSIIHANIQYKAGVIPSGQIKNVNRNSNNDKVRFLFSGNLDVHTGFPLALEVFKDLPDCELYISGSGNILEKELSLFPNIHYCGYLPYDQYLKLYDKVTVCLSFRDPSYDENNNNFPSKILEYFSYGKVVLSTIKYPELKDFHFLSCNFDKECIKNEIRNIMLMSADELNYFRDNRKALLANFSTESWKKCLDTVEDY